MKQKKKENKKGWTVNVTNARKLKQMSSYYCQIVHKTKDMITVRHWKRTFPNAKEEDRIFINMHVQIDSKIWQKLTRLASTLWTPQGLGRLTLWLQLGKAWWDTSTVPALGRQIQEHHCKFEASPGLYGECQDT